MRWHMEMQGDVLTDCCSCLWLFKCLLCRTSSVNAQIQQSPKLHTLWSFHFFSRPPTPMGRSSAAYLKTSPRRMCNCLRRVVTSWRRRPRGSVTGAIRLIEYIELLSLRVELSIVRLAGCRCPEHGILPNYCCYLNL